jgi:hypothetical protein
MPLPVGVETVTLTSGEPLTLPDGTLIQGTLTFIGPDLGVIPSDDLTFGGGKLVRLVGGEFTVTLIANDATDINPSGGTYQVKGRFANAPDWVRYVQLLKATPAVILADVLVPDPITPVFADAFLPLAGGTMSGPLALTAGGVDVDVQEALSTALSTGVMSGGTLDASATPSAVDIGAMTGYIVDYVTDATDPVVTQVSTAAQTVALDAGALARSATYWLVSSAGTVVQQAGKPTNAQRRTHIVLGVTAYDIGTATIFVDQSTPQILSQLGNQLIDLMDALGPFVVDGNQVTANGANLQLAQASGRLFARAFSHYVGAVQTNDPHIHTTIAQAPANFRYGTSSTTVFPAAVTVVDPANYDLGGVVTPVGGGVGRSTIQRIWVFPTNTTDGQLAIQYGQTVYSTKAAAVAALAMDPYVVNPLFPGAGALLAVLVVTRTATDLSDTSQAEIFMAGMFGSGLSRGAESLALYALLSGAIFTGAVTSAGAASTDTAFAGGVTGDAFDRFRILESGLLEVGPGSAGRDTNWRRSAANEWTTDDAVIVSLALRHLGTTLGFYGATATTKPAVTGSRGGNAALASLLTGLATLGLITDSTTA